MHVNPIVNTKFIYQYGNVPDDVFVFYKGGFNKLIQTGVKEVTDTSAFITGDIDNKNNQPLNKSSYMLDIDFTNQYSSPYPPDYINKIFMGQARYAFFYDYSRDTSSPYPDIEINKFYYNNFVRSIKPPDVTETERENRYDGEENNNVILKMPQPFFYDCSEAIEWINYTDYLSTLTYWGATTWGGSFWGFSPTALGLVKDLTNEEKKEYFSDIDPRNINYFLRLRDRFFARDVTQTARRYVVNNTFTAGGFSNVQLTNEFNNVTANTSIYRIEISNLSAGQTVEITNITNDSGISITWDSPSPSGVLVFNSYYGNLYSTSSELDIDPTLYSVSVKGSTPLYFTGLYNPFRMITLTPETLRVNLSSGTNSTIKIDVLPTYD